MFKANQSVSSGVQSLLCFKELQKTLLRLLNMFSLISIPLLLEVDLVYSFVAVAMTLVRNRQELTLVLFVIGKVSLFS